MEFNKILGIMKISVSRYQRMLEVANNRSNQRTRVLILENIWDFDRPRFLGCPGITGANPGALVGVLFAETKDGNGIGSINPDFFDRVDPPDPGVR